MTVIMTDNDGNEVEVRVVSHAGDLIYLDDQLVSLEYFIKRFGKEKV